jgi:CheY-like chemotaxis protein
MTRLQIVLADDDADDRSLFREAVMKISAGTELVTVEDGQELMDYLDDIEHPPPPHIIFLDINMPCKTGDVCLKEIRTREKFRNVPIVMFSTSSHPPDINESYESGANMYVSKSVFFEDEVSILKKIISTDWKAYIPKPPKNNFVYRQ